jgi:hypothetical protein
MREGQGGSDVKQITTLEMVPPEVDMPLVAALTARAAFEGDTAVLVTFALDRDQLPAYLIPVGDEGIDVVLTSATIEWDPELNPEWAGEPVNEEEQWEEFLNAKREEAHQFSGERLEALQDAWVQELADDLDRWCAE